MTDTQPTDNELVAFATEEQFLLFCDEDDFVQIARAVLAKWGTPPAVMGKPVMWAYQYSDGSWHDASATEHSAGMKPLYPGPQPTQAQAGAVPLDEARRLFDAGWKAAALFCDREDVVADGIIGFGACPQFEAAFSAAHGIGIKGGQHGAE